MLHLFNTLTKQKEEFKPLKENIVTMYNCGPTVYSYAHIGNFSSYLMADLLRRYLEYLGYEVQQVKNITDVGHLTSDADEGEDKLEKAAREEQKDPYEIARFYEKFYLEDEKRLHLLEPMKRPRATEHVEEMIEMIKVLEEKGYVYETADGLYFEIEKFPDYGRLSGNTLENLEAGKRVEVSEEKKKPYDFAVWKKLVGENAKHIMQWASPWGPGFPGWHIECSAMSRKYLGDTIDIHTGGEDNIFPHHECEIAQSEGCSGKPFVKYWIHRSFITVNEEKMSKSRENFYVLDDVVNMGYEPLDFRYVVLSAHYRSKMNFSEKSLADAKHNRHKIKNFIANLQKIIEKEEGDKQNKTPDEYIKKTKEQFETAMNDDLNSSGALAAVFEFMKHINSMIDKNEVGQEGAEKVLDYFKRINEVFVFIDFNEKIQEEIPGEIFELVKQRNQARKEKKYDQADAIRARIEEKGYEVRDEGEKTEVVKI